MCIVFSPVSAAASRVAGKAASRARTGILATAALIVPLLVSAPADAGWFDRDPEAATAQAEGRAHRGPKAYHAMCAREPELCFPDRQAGINHRAGPAAAMDQARWDQLLKVNDRFNDQIRGVTDRDLYGVSEHWTLSHTAGDCEDYAIAKKQALMQAGWAADQLLYAVVEDRGNTYHAVLIVRTQWGDYVLDNKTSDIAPWEDTFYRFIIRQSAANPHAWVRIAGSAGAVASASDGFVTR